MSKPKPLEIFIPLSKVDEEQRLVYGLVAEEIADNSGEVFDYDSSKPHFEKWSSDQEAASQGKSKGNLRAMHGKVAAGILTDLGFNDLQKTIECCAHVVDDNEWAKVLTGTYTGFSMGGSYARRWKLEKNSQGVEEKRYTAKPVEVSLVDKPCIKTATFDFVKADGMVLEVEVGHSVEEALEKADKNQLGKADTGENTMAEYVPTNDELSARGMVLAKAAGKTDADWLDFSDAARAELVSEHLAKGDNPFAGKEKGEEDEEAKKKAKKPAEGDAPADADADKKPEGTPSADEEADKGKKKPEDEETAEKAASSTDIEQVWKATDGTTFLKKSDAATHQATLDGNPGGSLIDRLELAKADVSEILTGETAPAAEAETVIDAGEDFPSHADLTKYANLLEGTDLELRKGMYEVSRTALSLRELASLQINIASEARREGDGSTVPATLMEGVEKVGQALIAMAKEEVEELTRHLATENTKPDVAGYCYPDSYMALAASTLGLEKADLDTMVGDKLQKADVVDTTAPATDEVMEKMAALETSNNELADKLEKAEGELAKAAPIVEQLVIDIAAIKAMPRPSAPITSIAMEKADDGLTATEKAHATLEKFTPDQLADAAIRLAQEHGRPLVGR